MDSRETVLNIVFPACGLIALVAAGYKLAALRGDRHNPALYVLIMVIVFPATAFLLAAPAIYRTVDRWLGVPNLSTLLIYSFIVVYSVTALVMLLLWQLPARAVVPRALRLVAAYTTVLVAMAVLFVAAGADEERPLDFDAHYGPEPVAGTFLLVYVSAFAFGLASIARRSWRWADLVRQARTDRPWLRRGMRVLAVGSTVALGYSVGKAAFVVGAWAGVPLNPLNDIAIACACLGAMLTTAGFTMPSWGPRLGPATDWSGRWLSYHRLYPLWRTVFEAVPGIALDPPRTRLTDLANLTDLDVRLYRRIVEILDGRLALAPYLDESAAQAVVRGDACVDPSSAAARAEAARLRAAAASVVLARTNGVEPAPAEHPAPRVESGGDPLDALAWLLQVARALRELPEPASSAVPAGNG